MTWLCVSFAKIPFSKSFKQKGFAVENSFFISIPINNPCPLISLINLKLISLSLFKKYSPDEFKIDSQELLVLSEGDIIGIIEN